jgi:hypothetical protein
MVIDSVNFDDNSFIARFYGTNTTIRFMHIDEADLIRLNNQKDYMLFSPNQLMSNFPVGNRNGGVSIGHNPHVHLEERINGRFANPDTHAISNTRYWWKFETRNFLGQYSTSRFGYY